MDIIPLFQDVCITLFSRDRYAKVKNAAVPLLTKVVLTPGKLFITIYVIMLIFFVLKHYLASLFFENCVLGLRICIILTLNNKVKLQIDIDTHLIAKKAVFFIQS